MLAAIGIGIHASRWRDGANRPTWFLPSAAALLFSCAAAGILVRAHLARHPYRGAALAVWEVVWLVEKSAIVLTIAKVVVIGIALFATLGAVWTTVRRGDKGSPEKPAWIGSSLLALLGVVVWTASRPMAHDGGHPLAFPRGAFAGYRCPTSPQWDPRTLPRTSGNGEPCSRLSSQDLVPLAILEIGEGGATVGGRPLDGPSDAFSYVNTQRLLRDAGNPPGSWSAIFIAAPASMPAEALGPWLGAVANANQRFRVVLLRDEPAVVSATAGTIARRARCLCPRLVLDPEGTSLEGRRWGDVASQAAALREDAPLVLDPGYFLRLDGATFTIVKGRPPEP